MPGAVSDLTDRVIEGVADVDVANSVDRHPCREGEAGGGPVASVNPVLPVSARVATTPPGVILRIV